MEDKGGEQTMTEHSEELKKIFEIVCHEMRSKAFANMYQSLMLTTETDSMLRGNMKEAEIVEKVKEYKWIEQELLGLFQIGWKIDRSLEKIDEMIEKASK